MRRSYPTEHGWLAYYRELLATWRRKEPRQGDAQDTAHDAIANMLAGDVSAIRNPRAYLHRSMHHGLINQHTRLRREAAIALQDLREDEHPPNQDDPESHARTAQLSRALLDALAELPHPCAAVFAWHRLEGQTVPEIAATLGLSVSSVEKYLARTMRHLHARLHPYAR
ncbi:RNA polymerase sigma factor [Achromobacter aloeverae]|uniref:RNA polymerase ECF-subfamily sigma-70 factor n=1 Tax=Achromobacter aloeverae TaxID=1750518 RepID=A0A4Q1HJF4_9BURK|nr:sigma-70 family RNA polymerase sigma factor [Achromobacter aloeverae]RXN87833.1 RNA polymerase ECF-subfamily sigma-70 factor [Achromobacter aloeverae]